jgi:glycosyltransferase involved in cell wall biosynthesis
MHDYVIRRSITARLLRRYVHRCSAIVTNSKSVADDVRHVCGSAVAVRPVWNAVDLTRFSPDGPRVDLDAMSGLPPVDGVLRVGLVATFARWKGHRTFLNAMAMLPASLPVRGYIVGGPVYETSGSQVSLTELRDAVASLGLESRVGFTGFVQNSAAAMRALDIVVHASTEPEPFGLVIAEALACGKPVVASRAGGAFELTESGVNALGHEPGDAQALARRIEELVRDADLRRRLGQAGRASAEAHFSRRRMTNELTPIYRSLAAVR